MEMIRAEHLSKTFDARRERIHAVRDVSFSIQEGEIFGVIGLSGAGKSTLVRCLNLLERPTSGHVYVNGRDLTALSESALRQARQEIGMIFQGFNLLMQRSVVDNVCFPMEIAGIRKREARVRALDYLRTVGLEEKSDAYPAQLSVGQMQRVAIDRVLDAKTKILLGDEAS
ncbi:MAG: ATP-binding cassette domain-containing protein, partial [Oscillibacter sp.]|nr:ATP-binding cassette domain-containing protein [Oscillibacter sp.]